MSALKNFLSVVSVEINFLSAVTRSLAADLIATNFLSAVSVENNFLWRWRVIRDVCTRCCHMNTIATNFLSAVSVENNFLSAVSVA